jgi:DNA repair ATPase RecN
MKAHICNDPELCWDHIIDARDALRAENARLQERVEKAEGGARMLRQELDAASKREKTAEALSEQRKDALRKLERGYDNHPGVMAMGKGGVECSHCGCLGGHGDVGPFAAIEEEK